MQLQVDATKNLATEAGHEAAAARDLAESTHALNRPYMAVDSVGNTPEVDAANKLVVFALYTRNFGSIPATNVWTKVRAYINGWTEMPIFYIPQDSVPPLSCPGKLRVPD